MNRLHVTYTSTLELFQTLTTMENAATFLYTPFVEHVHKIPGGPVPRNALARL